VQPKFNIATFLNFILKYQRLKINTSLQGFLSFIHALQNLAVHSVFI